jgi:hypothetical protein
LLPWWGGTKTRLIQNAVAPSADVSPQEEFTCSLGSDASVRIVYKPLHRFKEVQGLLSKANVLRFHQAIEIKNTKTIPIRVRMGSSQVVTARVLTARGGGQLVVEDPFPESTDDKIKVQLIEPDPKRLAARPNPAAPAPAPAPASASATAMAAAVASGTVGATKAVADTVRQNDNGCLEWALTLAAKATHTLDIKYTVTSPVGEVVDGLPHTAGDA